jgi:hypothetical protein
MFFIQDGSTQHRLGLLYKFPHRHIIDITRIKIREQRRVREKWQIKLIIMQQLEK